MVTFNTDNPFTGHGKPLSATQSIHHSAAAATAITATMRAMERAGVIRTLAEPNLTAISGESSNFLAGGEFPVPAGYTCDPVTRQLPDTRSSGRNSASA